ncbi:MAG: GAF domain-containing protein [Firmicutes bacterium]|nr:GAF domain-containing protein [Bacillota bacterium]
MQFNSISPREWRSSIRDTPLTLFLQEIANYVCTIGGYDFSSVLLRDEHLNCLRILGVANLSMEYVQRINEEDALQLEQPEIGYAPSTIAYLEKRPVAIHDVFADDDFRPWVADAQREGYRALLCVPLLMGSDAVGVLDVYQRSVHTFTEEEISFFTAVAGLAAMAVEAKQTTDRLQASLAALRDARELHRRMLNASGLDQVGQTLSDFLNCCVAITDPNGTCLWSNAKYGKITDLGQALGADWLQHMRQATTGDVILFSPSTHPEQKKEGKVAAECQTHAPSSMVPRIPTQAGIAMYGSGTPQGYIIVDLEENIAEEALRLDLEEASLVAAHILLEERRRLDVLHQSQEELASDILHGRFRNRESILARAANLGFDVHSPHAVVVLPQQKEIERALQRLNLQPHPSPLISHEGRESLVLLVLVLARVPYPRTDQTAPPSAVVHVWEWGAGLPGAGT